MVLSATGFDALTQAVTNNGFTDWAELSALGEQGYETYVQGGAETVTKALNGINIAYNWIPLMFITVCVIMFCFFHLESDLKKLRVENGLNEDGTRPGMGKKSMNPYLPLWGAYSRWRTPCFR